MGFGGGGLEEGWDFLWLDTFKVLLALACFYNLTRRTFKLFDFLSIKPQFLTQE